jgi:hypothetical protein
MLISRIRPIRTVLMAVIVLSTPARAQDSVTSPGEAFGHEIGADYFLANYAQLQDYWQTLARESERMVLQSIGNTEEGRPQLMAIITSPENHRNLDRYRQIARRLALAEGISEAQALQMASEGKAVVWIDGGLHASEVLGAQQLMELVYRMVSRNDAETLRILDDVILLAVHANPDGHDLVANWYMRESDPEARTTSMLPVLYHKYAGHDNNRDFYMVNLAETENICRILYREWFPQIVYNHHQTGPAGTIMFAPPFRDPPNHNLDPLILTSLEQVGSAMHARFVKEGKGGTTMRSGARYSTWWNGGLRTTPYFKNMIGLLTETIGHPTPMEVPFLPNRQISSNDLPLPVEPGVWHFRQSIEYSQTANMAVLDYASRNSDHLLFNIWRMGANAIDRGSRDNWTILPFQIDAAGEALQRGRGDRSDWESMLRDRAKRDARGYIVPADQSDFPTATTFVNILIKGGVQVHQATRDFTVSGKSYPVGSFVVKADQAFRPHVLDMFEPQNHPNDFAYPGAPPTAPYDNTGWTLAFQMGVEFDRILDAFDGPFEAIADLASVPSGRVSGPLRATGYLLRHDANNAFVAINRLLAGGEDVFWLLDEINAGESHAEGTFYIPGSRDTRGMLASMTEELGISFTGVSSPPGVDALKLRPVKIGLWDRYGGSMPSGWIRFMLEQFEFDFELVFAPQLDAGDLNNRFDVLIFPDGAIPSAGRGGGGGGGRGGGRPSAELVEQIPPQYRDRLGSVTADQTVPQIMEFIQQGGTVITVGSSTNLAFHAGLPIRNHLVAMVEGQERPLRSEDYFVPGSILDMKVEHVSPLTHGIGDRLDVNFGRSPVFTLEPGAEAQGVRRIGWYDTAEPLRSGWAWGQHYLQNGTAMVEARIGDGYLFLFGPRVTYRAQPYACFPLVFNGIYYGTASESRSR